jgi:hypothetical protein
VRTQTLVTLDGAQREAIRSELELYASGWGDFEWGFASGEREFVQKAHRRLTRMIAVMDAIGWSEQPDSADTQAVFPSRALAAWSRREAKGILSSFKDVEPGDHDLDAYEAFCALGASEAV